MTTQQPFQETTKMATTINKTHKNLSVFRNFPEFLKEIWKQDSERPWEHYFKEQQFAYFWDTGKDAQK